MNWVLITGLCLIPGSFVVAFVMVVLFQSWEIGALAVGGVAWVITMVAALAMTCIGIGMSL